MPIYLVQEFSKLQFDIDGGLRAFIPDLIESTSLDAIIERYKRNEKEEESTIVIVYVPRHDRSYFDSLVEIATQTGSDIFLILISDEISVGDYKRLIKTGGADWASAKANPSEVMDIIARRQAFQSDTASGTERRNNIRPVTISFVPSAGGVGNTTLLIETAAYLKTDRSTRDRAICLVDLDFQTSHMCDYLDSEPRLQIAELSNAPGRLDERLFESFRTRHNCGIDIFAAPRAKFFPEQLNLNALDALLSMIARRYELVLIDCPVTWFKWTPQVITASDGIIITGNNTIPCLRQISETLALIRSNGSAALRVGVAINRCDRTLLGSIARRKHIEMVLPNEQLFFVANRQEAIESVNMGVPMSLGASAAKIRKEFAPMVAFCEELVSLRMARV